MKSSPTRYRRAKNTETEVTAIWLRLRFPTVNQVALVRQPQRKKPYPYIDGPIEVSGTLKLRHKESEDPPP